MPKYINAEELQKCIEQKRGIVGSNERYTEGYNDAILKVKSMVHSFNAADVQEIKHGKWIDVFVREVYVPDEKTTITLTEQKCSYCNVVTVFKGNKQYLSDFSCPNCGAKMDRKEDDMQEVKHSGIIRRVDDFGRIAIPKEIRKQFEIHDGDPLGIIADNNGIKLVKYIPEDERNDE